jgi:hypothetical protein
VPDIDAERHRLAPVHVLHIRVHDQAIARRHDHGLLNVLAVVLHLIEPHPVEIDVGQHPETADRRQLAALDRLAQA